MKKIGIITFHRSLNYGSALQNYALQQKIKELSAGDEVETIDYYPERIKWIRSAFIPVRSPKNILTNGMALLFYPAFRKRREAFDSFLEEQVKVGKEKYFGKADMSKIDDDYDILVAGSDQIWNTVTVDFSDKYFFVDSKKAKKIAYAPSIGNGTFSGDKHQKIQAGLKDFSAISVREGTGAEKLKIFLGQDVPVVIDPTLLIDKTNYEKIASNHLVNEKYIFMYSVHQDEPFLAEVKKISKKTGLPVYTVYAGRGSFRVLKYGFHLRKDASPQDFLALIRDAELVVSNSFHGTAFSVIFQKNFFSIVMREQKTRDVRIDTLLTKIGLEDRMLFYGDVENVDFSREIDYSKIQPKINDYCAFSVEYLKNALGLEK